MFALDTIHLSLPNGDTFSLACVNGRCEVAVLRRSPGRDFVPVHEWSGEDYDDDVLPISGSAESLAITLGAAIRWAEGEKARLMALALDQAL